MPPVSTSTSWRSARASPPAPVFSSLAGDGTLSVFESENPNNDQKFSIVDVGSGKIQVFAHDVGEQEEITPGDAVHLRDKTYAASAVKKIVWVGGPGNDVF